MVDWYCLYLEMCLNVKSVKDVRWWLSLIVNLIHFRAAQGICKAHFWLYLYRSETHDIGECSWSLILFSLSPFSFYVSKLLQIMHLHSTMSLHHKVPILHWFRLTMEWILWNCESDILSSYKLMVSDIWFSKGRAD